MFPPGEPPVSKRKEPAVNPTTTRRLLAPLVLCLVSVAACSTPATRIRAHPEAFARLGAQEQALVKAGQIALGFDFDTVKLALGEPDRITRRTTADGETVVWHYLAYEAEGRMLFTGHYHTARGWWGGPAYPYYLDFPNRRVRDRFSVQFQHGRVSAITEDRAGY